MCIRLPVFTIYIYLFRKKLSASISDFSKLSEKLLFVSMS